MKKYKFMSIEQVYGPKGERETFAGKPCYRIYNLKSRTQIGIISYYAPWRQYVFSSQPECVFNNACLKDVIDFMENHAGKESRDE